jgi:UDPglucose 6-dehydrogenase
LAVNVTVIGTGYVGLVAAVGFAELGNTVIGVDADASKIGRLSRGEPTIYEPGLEELLRRNLGSGRLSFTTDMADAVRRSRVLLIAVGTPPRADGSPDLSQVDEVARAVARHRNGHKVVATKSTVPVGTGRRIRERIEAGGPRAPLDVVSNPEFLREGKAVQDFFHPDRVVIGAESASARDAMRELYRPLCAGGTPFVWCNLQTAELIKYACNAFLATKISFANQLANMCEAVGADIDLLVRAVGMDPRIGGSFLQPGPGFGGSCLPKDARAMISLARRLGVDAGVVEAAVSANEGQKRRIVEKLRCRLGGLQDMTICVLGLAFKADTDDVRDSPAISIIDGLLRHGARARVHDPRAGDSFRAAATDAVRGQRISVCADAYDAARGADAVLICTEWDEYRSLDLGLLRSEMRGTVLLDARNILDASAAEEAGLLYEGTGRATRFRALPETGAGAREDREREAV